MAATRLQNFQSFLRGAAVLKDDQVGVEGIEFTGAKAVNGVAYTLEKLGQTNLVILRNWPAVQCSRAAIVRFSYGRAVIASAIRSAKRFGASVWAR